MHNTLIPVILTKHIDNSLLLWHNWETQIKVVTKPVLFLMNNFISVLGVWDGQVVLVHPGLFRRRFTTNARSSRSWISIKSWLRCSRVLRIIYTTSGNFPCITAKPQYKVLNPCIDRSSCNQYHLEIISHTNLAA